MSFLYVTYVSTTLCAPSHVHSHFTFQIITYTLLSSSLGLVVDKVLGKDDACSPNFRSDTRTALIYVSGVGGSPSTSFGSHLPSFYIDLLHGHLLYHIYIYPPSEGSPYLEPKAWDFQREQQAEEA